MVELRLPLPAPGLARALRALVLLAGIVAMHTVVFALPAHGHAQSTDHTARAVQAAAMSDSEHAADPVIAVQAAAMPDSEHAADPVIGAAVATLRPAGHGDSIPAAPARATADGEHGVSGPDCGGAGCSGTHGAMHGCVFILAAVTLLLALVVLYRLAVDRPGTAAAPLRHRRPRRERAPPWTVLSLAELSILRI
ncbi:hypothetical protein NBRGN_075_00040 [Nocardia brasiliensis NBRC 14402]|uniref:DUF6153 family protein n=1 Tax=Nocardia brasiliensis TaxID=37326 RepID=UPI0003004813|nr:DUF6153 family protein [Nocardia brasiliensis]ASF11730.1 hypothetical protein CEQ30_35270 [Nocardia brasiliensis]GAJ84501.1 hypothetical protein NBRGN_075_00040 [Nocardia brasiliensis NBRC 14402]SUB09449.1 Uncharacterised protein [Nocardia brasiliensis]